MLHTLKLLLPALIPSWNFFDVIAPSPRIQFVILNDINEQVTDWYEFRPRPARVSFFEMLARMLWNPVWNESLFMMSCAEHLLQEPTQHSEDEILKRIATEISGDEDYSGCEYLQFRLLLVRREDTELIHELVYESAVAPLAKYASGWQ